MLYSGMILPLFWGLIARIKIYFRNHSWISWDFIGFHKTPNGNNPQYLEDFLQGFFSTAHVDCCGPPTISKKSCCIGSSDLHLPSSTRTIIYSHLVPMGMDQDISKHIQHPFVHLCFCIFAGNGTSIKTSYFDVKKKGIPLLKVAGLP